jgi:hypothetical protein
LRYRYIFADGAGQVMRTFDVPLSKKALAKSMKGYAKADAFEVLNIHVISTRGEKDDAPTIGGDPIDGDVDAVARLEAEVRALERKRDELRAKGKKKNATR